jgi:uncharacterized protein (DUF1501 family)
VTVAQLAAGGLVEGKGVFMVRKMLRAGVFAALGMVAMVLAYGATNATAADEKKDEKVPTISEIMVKGHKGTDAYIAKIKAAAKDEKWDDAKEYAKTLAFFGENLSKNKPPKGDEKSWATLTKAYADATKATYKATQDKDVKAVNKGLAGIVCGSCHKAHK